MAENGDAAVACTLTSTLLKRVRSTLGEAGERLRSGVERIKFSVPLRVSVGLASWPDLALDRDGLVRNADAALYDAKRAGKNRTTTTAAA